MAFTNTVSFSGKQSFDYFSPALFDNTLFKRFTIIPDVQNVINLPNITLTGMTVAESCAFSDAGTIAITPRVLSVCGYKINKDICRTDLEPGFLSLRLKGGANGPATPDDFANYIVDLLTRMIGNDMQNLLWGSTGASCNGLMFQWGGTGGTTFAGGVVGVTAAAGVTAGNVLTEIAKVYAAIPGAVLYGDTAEKPIILVPPSIAQAYVAAQAATTGGLFMTGAKELLYNGLEVVVAPYMPDRRMVAVRPSNIYIGVDMFSDMQTIQVLDMTERTGENKARLTAHWKFGVQSGINAEIVYYA